MTIHRRGAAALLLATALAASLVAGCATDDARKVTAASNDRPAVVADLIDDVVVPAYDVAATTATAFASSVDALCAAPTDATLGAARVAAAAGWAAWRFTGSFDIGPAMTRRSVSVMSYAADGDKIEAALASAPPADAATVRNRTGSPLRGYGAASYLLTGPADAPVTAAAFADPARCGYLAAVAEVLADETAIVHTAWTDGVDGAPAYRSTATGSGAGALDSADVIDAVVNMQLAELEASEKAVTAAVESGSDGELPPATLFALAAQASGVSACYDVLGSLLAPTLTVEVKRDLAELDEVLRPFAADPNAPTPDATALRRIAAAVAEVRTAIATEVVSALDVTITFSDNDGDS